MIDIKYINQCKKGETSSYRIIYEGTSSYVYAIIKNYIRDEEYRKDIMQESYAAIFSSIQTFDEEKGQFKSWISRITVFHCISFLRKNSKMKFDYSLSVVEEIGDEEYIRLHDLSKEEIEEILKEMPLGYKTIFLLFVIDEFNHKEIAELLNISIETSRSQLMRGIQWIKKNISVTTSNKMAYGNR